jgi:hypothetical protein
MSDRPVSSPGPEATTAGSRAEGARAERSRATRSRAARRQRRPGVFRVWTAGAAVLTVSLAASCVALPQTKTGGSAEWSPASRDAMVSFLEHYDKVHNEASTSRDRALMATIESGPLLRASQAQLRIADRLAADDAPTPAPVHRSDIHTYLPKFDGYPVWFVAVSKEHDRLAADLVVRTSAKATWRKTQSLVLDPGVTLPEIATRDGFAVAIPTDQRDGLVRSPAEAARAYAGLLQNGRHAPHAKAFVPHADTELAHQAQEKNKAQTNAFTYRQTFEVTSVRALAAKDGSAFVLFSLTEAENLAMRNASLTFNRDDAVAAYTGLATGTTFLRTTWVWQVAAIVPPAGAKDLRVRLLGTDRALASAEMR